MSVTQPDPLRLAQPQRRQGVLVEARGKRSHRTTERTWLWGGGQRLALNPHLHPEENGVLKEFAIACFLVCNKSSSPRLSCEPV